MTVKVSANIDTGLMQFLEHYQTKHQIKTRSEALEAAIRELRRAHLRSEYAAAAQDPEYLAEIQIWDATINDGLNEPY